LDHKHEERGPDREVELAVEEGEAVAAQAEVGDVAEGELTGVAADEVPGEADAGEQEDAEQDVEEVVLLDEEGNRFES